MSSNQQFKNRFFSKIIFSLVLCSLVCLHSTSQSNQAYSKSIKLKSKKHLHVRKKHKPTKEENLAIKEAKEHEAQENKLSEGKNLTFAKAYRLYDSGTSESLQGNHKYAVLQLKLANELLQQHGLDHSSLGLAILIELASSAQSAKDYPLAKSTYEKLITIQPQNTQFLIKIAKLEGTKNNFQSAQSYINKIMALEPNNAEAKLLSDLIKDKLKGTQSNIKEGLPLP